MKILQLLKLELLQILILTTALPLSLCFCICHTWSLWSSGFFPKTRKLGIFGGYFGYRDGLSLVCFLYHYESLICRLSFLELLPVQCQVTSRGWAWTCSRMTAKTCGKHVSY